MRRAGALGLVVVLGGLVWWAWRGADRERGATPAVAEGTAPPAPVEGPAPPRVRVPRRATARDAVALPTPSTPSAPTAPSAAPVAASPGPSPRAAALAAPAPRDRRSDPPVDAEAVRELLMQELRAVTASLQPCADAWAAADPSVDEALRVRFALDADGLQEVWIEGYAEAPTAVLDCFADAVWRPDWAGISADPLEVTWPVEVRGG